MQNAIRSLTRERHALTSPAERVKLKVAAVAIKRSKIVRHGPAEGWAVSAIDREILVGRHKTMSHLDRDALLAAAALSPGALAFSERIDTEPASPLVAPPMVRRWTSHQSALEAPVSWKSPTTGPIQVPHKPVAATAGSPNLLERQLSEISWREVGSLQSPAKTPSTTTRAAFEERVEPAAIAAEDSTAPSPAPPQTTAAHVTGAAGVSSLAVDAVGSGAISGSAASGPPASTSAAAETGELVPTGEAQAAETGPELVVADDEVMKCMLAMVGDWKCVATSNLDKYLKHIGVSWAKRKIAAAFSPEPSFKIDDRDGVLQCLMSTPIGDRLERFPLDSEVQDVDPVNGNTFIKRFFWESATLVSVARDPSGKTPDFVTKRRLNPKGQLVQINEHAGVAMERTLVRK